MITEEVHIERFNEHESKKNLLHSLTFNTEQLPLNPAGNYLIS